MGENLEGNEMTVQEDGEEVEGYKTCTTYVQRCNQDCWFLHNAVASAVE